jgi:prevent-host-death family protein
MVTVPARDLKNRTGEIVRRIERGEHVLITKRGKPLAVMRPARGGSLRRGKRREKADVIAEGVGLLAGFVKLRHLLSEKRAAARREDRKWGIIR